MLRELRAQSLPGEVVFSMSSISDCHYFYSRPSWEGDCMVAGIQKRALKERV